MGRAGRLRKPKLSGSHGRLNTALHELHKEAGLTSLSVMARALEGAGISRSTIYDAFSSTRLPSWHVVEALVEVLGTKHPQGTPEEIGPRFYELWQHAIDEEPEAPDDKLPVLNAAPLLPPELPIHIHPANIPVRTGKIWLDVPWGERKRARELGARWDYKRRSWYAINPGLELMKWHHKDLH